MIRDREDAMGKALVVDDNEINAMLAADILDACNVTADIADSGVQAIESVRIQDYPFVLMDYIMPGMDGIEATKEILKFKPDAVIYAMTGDLNDEMLKRFMDAGAKGAISKPLDIDEIIAVIRKHMKPGTYKLPKLSSKKTAQEKEEAERHLRFYIERVDGLNYDKGMTNALGNEQGYFRILKASVSNIRQYVDIMSEYKPGMDVAQLKISFHSLKSVFGNIGMDSMRGESESMEGYVNTILAETDGAAAARTSMEAGLELYIISASTVAQQLERVIADYEHDTVDQVNPEFYINPEQQLNDEELKTALTFMRRALDTCEIDNVLLGLDTLVKASVGDDRRLLEGAHEMAACFDYDGVRRVIDKVFVSE